MTYINTSSIISTGNTTTTPLSSEATFTGTGEQNLFAQVGVMCKTDNTCTLYFDFSNDGTNWDSIFPVNGFKIASGISEFHTAIKLGRYFRVRLVNDSGSQTYLRLTTYYGDNFIPSSAPLNQTIGLDSDAILARSTITQDEISIGRRGGVTPWTKFAFRDNLTSGGGEEIIWANTTSGDTFTPMTSADTFDIEYDGTGGGSTDGSGTVGATELAIYYIDSDGLPAIATHTLGTDGDDTTAFSGLGINRVAVSASGSNDTNSSEIIISTTTGGDTQAVIPANGGVTQQAIFFSGSNHDAIAKLLFFNVNKLSGSNPKVTIKGWIYNRNISTKFEVFRHIIDTQSENTITLEDPIGFKLSPTDVLYFTADTDQNNTQITFRFSLNEYQRT